MWTITNTLPECGHPRDTVGPGIGSTAVRNQYPISTTRWHVSEGAYQHAVNENFYVVKGPHWGLITLDFMTWIIFCFSYHPPPPQSYVYCLLVCLIWMECIWTKCMILCLVLICGWIIVTFFFQSPPLSINMNRPLEVHQ